MAGVSPAAETLKMLTPASIRAAKSVSGRTTVEIRGMSTVLDTVLRCSKEVGWLATTPVAPCISAKAAICAMRLPLVRPPPTPTKTGTSAAVKSAWVMTGWGVKG